MSFIEVPLYDWDCDKLQVGVPAKGGTPTILYNGKIPILTIKTNDVNNLYVVSSRNGLTKSMKFDSSTRKYTDMWDGEWCMNVCVARCVNDASPMAAKLMHIFDDIEKKVGLAYERSPDSPLKYTWITEKNAFGVEKAIGIDRTKGCYMNIKVPHDAPATAPKIKIDGKEVPDFAYRYPKSQFYDVTRATSDIKVKDPNAECGISMNLIPKIMLGVYANSQGLYITKRLMHCYYEPSADSGDLVDNDLINMMRNNLTLESSE